MFALSFRFPAGRYHATPWGRAVNESDVAWPPEPWRLLRALIATYWRKGDHTRWSEDDLARLIDALAESLPEFSLPEGAIHAHTRHYMPIAGLAKDGRLNTTLIFDAFLRLPDDATLVACWSDVTLDAKSFALAEDLACAMGYLGRAESWTECEALAEWDGKPNCRPAGTDFDGDPVRMIAPLSPDAYSAERQRLVDEVTRQVQAKAKHPLTDRQTNAKVTKELTSKGRKAHTLPERLVDALTLDTADYQDRGWSRPPASQEVIYTRAPEAGPGVVPRRFAKRLRSQGARRLPTVARFLLAGRPPPRIEDAVKIGELMRLAALAQFGWETDESTGRRRPNAPPEISGRDADGKPLMDPSHAHAFWLPEDADGDGRIDHVSVFIASGITDSVRAKLDRITRLWLDSKQPEGTEADPKARKEWRLALEGFGCPDDFASSARIFRRSRHWTSATPFMASGHLKKGASYRGEVQRLLARRGHDSADVEVTRIKETKVGGIKRRAIHFHRFRSRGREAQPDAAGALLDIRFPEPFKGPLAIGYGSHFGLGLFTAEPGRDID